MEEQERTVLDTIKAIVNNESIPVSHRLIAVSGIVALLEMVKKILGK